jgi:hypothetical protein
VSLFAGMMETSNRHSPTSTKQGSVRRGWPTMSGRRLLFTSALPGFGSVSSTIQPVRTAVLRRRTAGLASTAGCRKPPLRRLKGFVFAGTRIAQAYSELLLSAFAWATRLSRNILILPSEWPRIASARTICSASATRRPYGQESHAGKDGAILNGWRFGIFGIPDLRWRRMR